MSDSADTKLKSEVEVLDGELERLRVCQSYLPEVDKIKARLQQKIINILEELKDQAKVNIEDYFLKENSNRVNALTRQSVTSVSFHKNVSLIPNFINSFNLGSRNFKSKVDYKSSGIIEFKSKVDAQEFADQAVAWARKRAEKLFTIKGKQVEEEIETERQKLIDYLSQETSPIIEQAHSRLNKTFNLDLSLPQPNFESDDVMLFKPCVDTQYRHIDGGYGERVRKTRRWGHWLKLVELEVKETFKLPDTQEDYYTVSLKELITHINHSNKIRINSIKQGFNKYIDEDFNQSVDTLFTKLNTYLRNYQNSLKQAQVAQKLLCDEKEELISELASVIPEAGAKVKEAENYIERTDFFMRDK